MDKKQLRAHPFLYRAYGFAILAMSLASILDINTSGEYLKALGSVLSDYDSFLDETVKPGRVSERGPMRALVVSNNYADEAAKSIPDVSGQNKAVGRGRIRRGIL